MSKTRLNTGNATFLLGMAALVGLLTYWAAWFWTHRVDHFTGQGMSHDGTADTGLAGANGPGEALSAQAAGLSYLSQEAFRNDQSRAAAALSSVLARGPGAQEVWENHETSNRGLVWNSSETTRPDGSVCRKAERRTLINHAFRDGYAIVCRLPGGQWDADVTWTGK